MSISDIWETYRLNKGDLTLVILPGIGGRLWDIAFQGRSLLFQNPDLVGVEPDLANLTALPTRSPQFAFPLWGGEKTWIAPDTDWQNGAPFPTLDSAPYTVTDLSDLRIELRSQTCPISHLQIIRSVLLESASSWTIQHTVQNGGAEPRNTGIWSVMMLDHPTKIEVKAAANGPVTPVFGDQGEFVRHERAAILVDCDRQQEFKVGLSVPSGHVLMNQGDAATAISIACEVPPTQVSDRFLHGHNVEIFNSGDYAYCEAEWHSPARTLLPGEEMTFTQRFKVSAESHQDH